MSSTISCLVLRSHTVDWLRFDLLIATKPFTAIVFFGRWRQNLEDYSGIEQHVAVLVVKNSFAANNHQIRISVQSADTGSDFHVGRETLARRALELPADNYSQIETDSAVVATLACHCVNQAVQILVPDLRESFDFQRLLP